ncbi:MULTISPECIES: amidohydrolase family protein [unclassified Massilia]|uniref:amidohydrolase family protein n=1 Tax=unclassified Massilia TaxID=2609279 RepID=UPI0017809B74|nr:MULTISPECIES: amidohydrolase family protein [unclassified Massilia]MBD8528538.1 PD40 domain-containing protein [Massilia sp. CFBP 13647]MBD8671839.1 PD40 domain-containing protein [Massilia sp. CFBP 13721]
MKMQLHFQRTRPVARTVFATAVAAALLSACQWPGGGVDQLNDLRGPTRDVTVELREGTNMAAAPSPDGSRIVFSAQGALWVMPVAGGAARRITDYRLEPTAPVWSPDGKRIAFQNYAPEGNFHIWTIDPDGRNQRELTDGPFDDREPAWLPDGSGLVFSSDRSRDGQYKIWRVDAGGGAPSRVTTGPGAESNPVVSPDGTRLAYVDGANIVTRALAGGAPTVVAPGAAPAWTPDGTDLVYQNAARQLVLGGIQVTQDEDLFPFPVRFLPNGLLLYTSDGRIRTRAFDGSGRTDIAFTAQLKLRRPEFSKPKDRHFDDLHRRPVRGISAPVLSPDGRSIAFVALNDVWTMRIGEAPVRLTDDVDRDANPQWTADGSAVYFSSERGNAGQLAVDRIDLASRTRTRLAAIPGRSLVTPKLSPDGTRLAYTTLSGQLEIWTLATGTSEVILQSLSTQVSTPQWTPDGQRILLVDNERINNRFREGYNKLRVIDLATRQGTFYAVAPEPRQIAERDEGAAALAPDGSKVAFIMDSRLHVMPLGANGAPTGPARQVSDDMADLPTWGGDSQTILYKSAERVRTVRADGSDRRDIEVKLSWRQAAPAGRTVIHAGALWDGVGSSLRRDVDIVVEGNRIVSVEPHSAHDADVRVVDASGLTVMPGLIETHLHPLTLYQGGQFGQIAQLMLSYGITTAQSVAGPLHQSIEMREALEAGNLIGPRLFVSPPLWEGNRLFYSFARTLRTPGIADIEIAKAKRMDADFLKSYVRAPIPVMERIAQGALDLGVPSGTHMVQPGAATGLAGTTHLSATQRMGYGWSKSLARAITYQDAADVYGKADFRLIDTLFSSSALAGLDPGIVADPRFILVPPNFVPGLQNALPPTPAQLATIANDATQQAKVRAAGALVANGTDSPLVVPGISLHLNMRGAALVQDNLAVLQSVTRDAARIALVDKDLGTVEEGKLADLVVVGGNPLADVRAAADVRLVVKNGRVYTLDEILAPARTPAQLAARRLALQAREKLCREEPRHCEAEEGGHAH